MYFGFKNVHSFQEALWRVKKFFFLLPNTTFRNYEQHKYISPPVSYGIIKEKAPTLLPIT